MNDIFKILDESQGNKYYFKEKINEEAVEVAVEEAVEVAPPTQEGGSRGGTTSKQNCHLEEAVEEAVATNSPVGGGTKSFSNRNSLESQHDISPSIAEASMSSGLRRTGAKPPTSPRSITKLAQLNIKRAMRDKSLPHELLLMWANGIPKGGLTPTPAQQLYAAVAAAPYYAPKLANVEVKQDIRVKAVISAQPMTQEQWEKQYLNKAESMPAKPIIVERLSDSVTIEVDKSDIDEDF